MWKNILVLLLLFFQSEALDFLCGSRKAENSCICKHVTLQNSIVTEADCSRINLDDVPKETQLSYDLNYLDLSHNAIKILGENAISSTTLESLILSYNDINTVDGNFFATLPNLKVLNLNHNNLISLDDSSIFDSSKQLQVIDLSFNNIKTLDINIFLPLTLLKSLDLSYNDPSLGEWLTQSPDSLQTNLGLNLNIETLNLDNLGLKNLSTVFFSKYTALKHLSLADNHFEEVPQVPSDVEYLDLSGSDVSTLEAKHLSLHSVKKLKFDRMNKLENIHHYAFYDLTALEELSVRNCRNLKEFNELIFGVLHKNMSFVLKKLSLSGNSLQRLNSTYKFLFRQLDFVDLTDNPWNCDCDLLWLQEFGNLYRSEKIKCSRPSRVSSRRLIDLEDSDLPGCAPGKYGKKSHRVVIMVLAILIIILAALVGYLIYYSPSWYNRSRSVGPESPYSVDQE